MSESQRSGEPSALDALAHLEAALQILDQLEASAEIAAHVDLAICRLRDNLEGAGHKLEPRQICGRTIDGFRSHLVVKRGMAPLKGQ